MVHADINYIIKQLCQRDWHEAVRASREREKQMEHTGLCTRQIAARLFITEKTVESHRNNLMRKAKVKNSVQLIAYTFLTEIKLLFPSEMKESVSRTS